MKSSAIAAVMVHVGDAQAGLEWYQRAFPHATIREVPESGFKYLDIEGTRLEVVESDEKVASAPAGSIVYWRADNFDERLAQLLGIGATLYRGPMTIPGNRRMCQVKDPWGNCLGLRSEAPEQTHEGMSEVDTAPR